MAVDHCTIPCILRAWRFFFYLRITTIAEITATPTTTATMPPAMAPTLNASPLDGSSLPCGGSFFPTSK